MFSVVKDTTSTYRMPRAVLQLMDLTLPMKCIHDLQFLFGMQLLQILQYFIPVFFQDCFIALERFLDQIFGAIILHLQLAESVCKMA